MRYIMYLIISTFIFILQSTLCQYIAIAGIKPNLMLIFVVTIAFLRGNSEGLLTGIIMGLLYDCYFGEFIGVNLFLYGIIGYLSGSLTEHFNKNNIAAPLFLTFLATLVYDLGFYVLNIVLKGNTSFNIYLILNILPELIYNIVCGFAVYIIVYNIHNSNYIGRIHRF